METIEHLPKLIKGLRKDRDWSQKIMAEKLGVSTAYVNHLEKGNRCPSLQTFLKIAEIFEVPAAKLLNGEVSHATRRKVRKGKHGTQRNTK